jgi:peptidyl-prolyl cis-trans isomerase A (cyclophilin A)
MSGDNEEEAIVTCGTSKGELVLQFYRHWSPNGYDRAMTLFEQHFYDHSHFFRVVPHFLVQFGISYSANKDLIEMSHHSIPDDPKPDPPVPFEPGTISFAGSGENSRTSQLFIAYQHSNSLGTQVWETPIGRVKSGMEVAESFHSYGDMPPWGKGPVQGKIHAGPADLEEEFPLTDKFILCTVQRKLAEQPEEEGIVTQDDDEGNGDDAPNVLAAKTLPKLQQLRLQVESNATTNPQLLGVVALAAAIIALVLWRYISQRNRPKDRKSS